MGEERLHLNFPVREADSPKFRRTGAEKDEDWGSMGMHLVQRRAGLCRVTGGWATEKVADENPRLGKATLTTGMFNLQC